MKNKIYIIDDDPVIQTVLHAILVQISIEPKIYDNYQQALVDIKTDLASRNLPIAIFSDFMLPEGDGLDFLRNLRGFFSNDIIPFYFITGVQREMIESFVERNEYSEILIKPIHLETFKAIINKLIQLNQAKVS